MSQFELEIDPHDAPVDKVYRLNESENSRVELALPWTPPSLPHAAKLLVRSTHQHATLIPDAGRM